MTRIAAPSIRSTAGDGMLALTLAALGVATVAGLHAWEPTARPVDALNYVLIAAAALPLTVRRIWPLPALAVTGAATAGYLILGYPYGPILLSLAVAIYTAAARTPVGRAAPACAVVLVALVTHVLVPRDAAGGPGALAGIAYGSAWVVVPFAVGQVVRVGREAAARARAEDIQRHSYEERLRIAQEVHDVVGHGLAAINIQAEIALHVLPKRPDQAEPALAAISRTSKEALDELRATLSVVRRGEDGTSRTPAPGLDRIDEVVARVSAAGVRVHVEVDGTRRTLPTAVDLAAYRIVQEALTNVLRHADAAAATVRVGYQARHLDIEVVDDGRGTGDAPATGGHGLAGMRERVAALGGIFEAGARLGGGFRVRARLPLAGGAT